MTDTPLRSATPLRSRKTQPGSGTVRVICGVHTLEAQVAGRTVGDVRAALSQALNISPEAIAVVDGVETEASHLLQAGEQVEFVRLAGEKGRRTAACGLVGGGPGTENGVPETSEEAGDHGAQ